MLIYNRIVGFSNAIERILFSGIRKYFSSKQLNRSKDKVFSLLNSGVSDTSIGPFLNIRYAKKLQKYDFGKSFNGLILINENVADDIVSKIFPSKDSNEYVVVEGNSDLGLITINLIKSGVHHIISYVTPYWESICISKLASKYPDKISLNYGDVYYQSEKVILDAHDIYRKQGKPVIILGIVNSFHFIIALTLCIHKFTLWQNNVTVYLVLPEENLKFLTQFSSKMKLHIQGLFNVLFKVETIATYPSKAFLSNETIKGMVALIKITENSKCFKIIPKNDLDDYFIFLHIIGTKRRMPLIEVLENWIPKCGPYLISKGISPCTTTSDLLMEEFSVLFKILKNFEGFEYFKISTAEIYKEFLTKF